METLAIKLADLMVGLSFDSIPGKVIDKAKISILDHLACSFAGFHLDWSQAALELVKEFTAREESTVWISGFKTTTPYAAFVNSLMSNSILHEDQHLNSGSHPGTMVIPVAFSVGEKFNSSGKDIIAAIIAGYETIARLGKVISAMELSKRGFRPTSVLGPFGVAVTTGKLMGLNHDEMVRALGAAGSFASGVNEWAPAGTDDFYFQTANASYNGILSAYLARKGIKFANSIIEGSAGMSRAFTGIAQTSDYVFEDFEQKFEIMDVYYKPVPACAMVQTTAQLAHQLAKSGVDYRDIKEGTIKTSFMGKYYPGCDSTGPFTSMTQARMSNQYTFAAALYKKEFSNSIYEIYENTEIGVLAQKLRVEVDEEANKIFPGKQMIKINLVLNNGKSLDFIKEDIDHYANDKAAITEKFTRYSSKHLSSQRIDEIGNTINDLEKMESVSKFISLLNVK